MIDYLGRKDLSFPLCVFEGKWLYSEVAYMFDYRQAIVRNEGFKNLPSHLSGYFDLMKLLFFSN